jgi:hypothetical protein
VRPWERTGQTYHAGVPTLALLDATALRAAMSAYLATLRAHRQVLDRMNVERLVRFSRKPLTDIVHRVACPVPDADTGTNRP